MKNIKKYCRVCYILFHIPFAFTNAAKQRLRKKVRVILKTA